MLRILSQHKTPDLAATEHADLENLAKSVMDAHDMAGTIQLIVADDDQLRHLNASFRGHDRTTDVLSFDYSDSDASIDPNYEFEEVRGEIYISRNRVVAQAAEFDVSEHTEMRRLMIHALLHLAGFDHDTPEKLAVMESETDKFLQVHQPKTVLADSVVRKE